jgi:predicted transcriptional regulator
MAEVETWFGDVFYAAAQLLKQAAERGQTSVGSRQIAERSGRAEDEVMRAIRWLHNDGWLKADYSTSRGYSDVAEVYWVKPD